jgi:flavodoxin/ferredoxin
MKKLQTAIIYFSQTGNTEKVARAIAQGLAEVGPSPQLIRLEEARKVDLSQFDLIGVGTPVFYYKEPFNVKDFLKKGLPPLKGKHAFLFITMGGHPANILSRLAKLIEKKGAAVIGAFQAFGYDTYPPYRGQDRRKGHPTDEELQEAKKFGRDLLGYLERIHSGEKFLFPRFKREYGKFFRLSLILKPPFMRFILPKKTLIQEKCTACGICVQKCPVGNITLGPLPQFGDKCIYCYFCERICPEEAIFCDWSFIKKNLPK